MTHTFRFWGTMPIFGDFFFKHVLHFTRRVVNWSDVDVYDKPESYKKPYGAFIPLATGMLIYHLFIGR